MKKVLISLLVLAVAGGGAFAQGWTFNGLVSGGLGMFFLEDGDDDPYIRSMTWDGSGADFRTQLTARYANEDETAGFRFQIRSLNATDGTNPAAHFDFAYGWLNFMDDMITVYGGRIFVGHFNALDRMHGWRHQATSQGLLTVLRPMDGLMLGFGAAAIGNSSVSEPPQARFSFYARYDDPNGDFAFVFGIQNTNEHDLPDFEDFTAAQLEEWLESGPRQQWSYAYVSFGWTADEDMHLAFTARFQALEEFSDFGRMYYYVTFGHTGLVENMDLRAGASFGMSQSDAHEDFHLWIWGSVAYELNERVIPRLDLHYVMGGRWAGPNLHHWMFRDGATFNSDDMFVQIRPAVQLRATAASFLEIGCIFHIDLGDNGTFPGQSDGMNIGLYAMFRVSF